MSFWNALCKASYCVETFLVQNYLFLLFVPEPWSNNLVLETGVIWPRRARIANAKTLQILDSNSTYLVFYQWMRTANVFTKFSVHFPLLSSSTATHSFLPSVYYQAENIWSCILTRHSSKVNSFVSCFWSNCQNWLWSQFSVHIICKLSTPGEWQGLVNIVGNINGSDFTQWKLFLCNGFQVPLFSGPQTHS